MDVHGTDDNYNREEWTEVRIRLKRTQKNYFLIKSLWLQITETDLYNQERYCLPLLDIQR